MNPHVIPRELLAVAATLTAGAVLLACSGCNSHPLPGAAVVVASEMPGSPPTATPAPIPTPTSPAASQDAKSFNTTGPLVAEQQADVAAERNGRVINIAAQFGDHVKAGQLLALLDDRALRSEFEARKARISSAQAQVRNWEAEESSGKADLRRADAMRADRIISEEDWEHVKYKLDETIAEVARFRSEETAAEADLATADLLLNQSRVVAPFDGVVGRSSVRPAQEVKQGDVLFWITAEAPLHVLFTVPESVMAAFQVGKHLDLTTADYPGLHQIGRIVRVSPVVDPASGSVQVIGGVVGPSPLLKPGMQMQVRLAP